VDRGVAPPLAAQTCDFCLAYGTGLVRQKHGEVAERADPGLELRLPVVVSGVLRELVCCALGTEVVGMRTNSIMAVVRARNDDGEELSLGAGKLRRAEHDRLVEPHRGAQNPGVERHRLDDVEDLARSPDRGVVLALELAGRLLFVDQPKVRHRAILPYELHEGPRNAISCPLRSTEGEWVGIPEDTMSEFEPGQTDDRPASESAGVGARVTSILEAAEQAAEQIRSDALREVSETMRRAEADALVRIEELTREAERVRNEADDYARDIRQAVDSYGTQARREAEEEARALVDGAEEQARSVRATAEAMAEQIQADAHRRHETLQREARALEERRQRVLDGLRDLAAQLQDALVEPSHREDDSLVDALDVERRR
jgi:hypothetical protein